MTHALKTWPEFFAESEKGNKPFELRKEDRKLEVGDKVLLQEFDPENSEYTGKELERVITYILRDVPKFGLKPGHCILGLKQLNSDY